VDLIVAHGIWNLAASGSQRRRQQAARVARPGAGLFVHVLPNTLPSDAEPVPGESIVYTQFSAGRSAFTESQPTASRGGTPDPSVPITEYNRPARGVLRTGGPVIYEAAFRYT
jgi:hypothetical protein